MNDIIGATDTRHRSRHRATRLAGGTLGALVLLVGVGTTAAAPAQAASYPDTFLDTASTVWSYSDDASDPAAGSADRLVWTQGGFDDSAWKTANGSFGAKNGRATGIGPYTAKTLLNQYIDGSAAPDVPTYHFRSDFELTGEQLDGLDSLQGSIVYDDAVQVFVNGTKVAGFVDEQVEAAPEASRNQMYAGASNGDPLTSTFTVPASALVAGENTVAVALYQDRATSSDIYFDLTSLAPVAADEPVSISDVVLTIGADESERGITWYSDRDVAQVAQVAPASAMTGDAFPEASAVNVPGVGGVTTSGEFNRFATITGLAESTGYVYRVGSDDNGWSEVSAFTTKSFSGDYDFLFVGDPQIGASGNVANDQAGWADTLDVAQAAYPDAELLFSAGDQVERAGNEDHYNAFLAPEQLRTMPLVPVNGNHDVGSKAYEQHYNVPNLDPTAGAATSGTSSGGDYWFSYKDVLFMVINSNSSDYDSHAAFLEQVVAEQGASAKWKVLAFHHSIYSVAAHTNDTQIVDMRAKLPSIISDLGVDLVLQGHDHSYTRSYLIKDGELANPDETAAQGTVTAGPGEVLYVTANSASGSKYYDVKAPDAWFASVINQEYTRNYSNIRVTDDSITITTLRSEANSAARAAVNSVVDEVTLQREDTVAPQLVLPETETTVEQGAAFDALAGVTATDTRDGDLTAAITVSGSVDTMTPGTYALSYAVSDAAGNTATASRSVTVTAAPAVPGTPGAGSGTGPGSPTPVASGSDPLANTGAEISGIVAIAFMLLLGGALTLLQRRALARREG